MRQILIMPNSPQLEMEQDLNSNYIEFDGIKI